MKCKRCKARAVVALPSHHTGFCGDCFSMFFERQVEKGVVGSRAPKGSNGLQLLNRDDRVLMALSGGKDSLAMALVLKRLGYVVHGLHLDLGIPNSSAPARRKVEAFCDAHHISLSVVELEKEGLGIPRIKERLPRPVCACCGAIKRQIFNREAVNGGYTVLATGHNLDDETSRLFSNILRWDSSKLADQAPVLPEENGFARKVKPLWRLSEFETAAYCFLQGIEYHMGACPYSQGASFTGHKSLLADLEKAMPGQKLQLYLGFLERGREAFQASAAPAKPSIHPCASCGHPTNAEVCTVCRMRDAVSQAADA